MTRREHGRLTLLALLGAAVALFQCWYVYLPADRAAAFDLCQVTRHVDCFQSLHKFGAEMVPFGIPVIAALLALFLFMAGLALLAWTVEGAPREAWLALARLSAFPQAGLLVYVLLSDYVVAHATSPTTLLLAALSLPVAAGVVLRGGVRGVPLRAGAAWPVGLAAAGALLCLFLHGAGVARQTVLRVEEEREAETPPIRWQSFARAIPRAGAAMLGNPTAEREILLFVDPGEEASRSLLREAADLGLGPKSDLLLVLYAKGDAGARLVAAHAAGRLAALLRAPDAWDGDLAAARAIVERQEAAMDALGIRAFPTALWKDGKSEGNVPLAALVRGGAGGPSR
jgi:hypothetical protein